MIDLHSHILPGIDDGASSERISLEMARMARADGIRLMACTPHVLPPRYPNTAKIIRDAVASLRARLEQEGVDLLLVAGADVHIAHDLIDKLDDGQVPCLHTTRYFLLEPDHKVATPNLDRFCASLLTHGYRPILTHPERLTWIAHHWDMLRRLHGAGVVIQITAASLTGRFGKEPQRLAEACFEEGLVDIVATDAHNTSSRPPILSEARSWIARNFNEALAQRLTVGNPVAILNGHDIVRPHSGATAR